MRAIVEKYSSVDPRDRWSADSVGPRTTDTVAGGGGVRPGALRDSNNRGDAEPNKRRKKENMD
jgi:hypothetical protein